MKKKINEIRNVFKIKAVEITNKNTNVLNTDGKAALQKDDGAVPANNKRKTIEKIIDDDENISSSQYKIEESNKEKYQDKLNHAVKENANELSNTTWQMGNIKSQNDLEAFFKQNSNTKNLAQGLISLATVQKSSLDLLMLLMGATVRNKDDYDDILESLSAVEGQLSEGNEEAIDYFANLKSAVLSNKERIDMIEKIKDTVNDLIDRDAEHDKALVSLSDNIQKLNDLIVEQESIIFEYEKQNKTKLNIAIIISVIALIIAVFAIVF